MVTFWGAGGVIEKGNYPSVVFFLTFPANNMGPPWGMKNFKLSTYLKDL